MKAAPKTAPNVYVIADTRERAVIPFLEDYLKEFALVVRQVNTGDYLICRREGAKARILCCIERKTHADFGSSFCDGRYENVAKMLELRRATGCQLFFFMEGPAFPSPDRRFSRIPFANILAAATKLMVQHGIFVVQTEDEAHTAKRIGDFLRAYDAAPVAALVAAADGTAPDDAAAPDAAAPDAAAPDDGAAPDDAEVPEMLLGRIEQSDCEAVVAMWSQLRGISVVLGRILASTFSVQDLVSGRIDVKKIKELKTATGRTINSDAVDSLLSVRAGNTVAASRLLSGLRNITPAVANAILVSTRGIANLCSYPVGAIELIPIMQKTRTVKLGKVRAARIRHMLCYCEGRGQPDGAPPAGQRLGEKAPVEKQASRPLAAPPADEAAPPADEAAPPADEAAPPAANDVDAAKGKNGAALSDADIDDLLSELG